MQDVFKLSQSAVRWLVEQYDAPLLVLSMCQVERNYRCLQEHLPGVKIYYAMKSNPNPRIVGKLAELGSCFDVASDGEIRNMADMGIAPERIIYANPVKTASGLRAAHETGVSRFTYDSESEIGKMAKAVPGGTVLLRVRVDNTMSHVDLNKKFGASASDALRLLRLAAEQGLDVAGLCFHVGSQCTNPDAYFAGIQSARQIFDEAAKIGLQLRVLDIGGGFPIPVEGEDTDIAGMLDKISQSLAENFPDTEIWAEPGRFLCGTAVNLITRVIGEQERNGRRWYFLDDGLYGTFSGIIFDHWTFEFETFKDEAPVPAVFAGPSCDSLDVLFQEKMTPPLALDDLILVPSCGAYTSASATVFNGFAKTGAVVWEEVVPLMAKAGIQ